MMLNFENYNNNKKKQQILNFRTFSYKKFFRTDEKPKSE